MLLAAGAETLPVSALRERLPECWSRPQPPLGRMFFFVDFYFINW
jgi:hypothetical protein